MPGEIGLQREPGLGRAAAGLDAQDLVQGGQGGRVGTDPRAPGPEGARGGRRVDQHLELRHAGRIDGRARPRRHGPAGRGNPGPPYPSVAGQFADYTARQLELFREGMALGTGDHANSVMADVAAELTDEEIQALASYIEGLHPNPVAAE